MFIRTGSRSADLAMRRATIKICLLQEHCAVQHSCIVT